MLISPINNINTNRKSQNLSFQRKVTYFTKDLPAKLEPTTIKKLSSLMSGYVDILTKLKTKTSEGIKFLQENFPNITIGESLIFHNCGDDGSSILLQVAEDGKNKGLVRFIERQGASSWGNRIFKRAFLLEENKHILKTENPNNQNIYPKERIYFTEGEVEELNYDEELDGLLDKLDSAMLSFRLFLNRNANLYVKAPSGKLNSALVSTMEQIDKVQENIDKLLAKLPTKVAQEVKRSFSNYKPTTGSSTQVFQNLGDERYTISYHSIDSDVNKNLNRLSVFDENGSLVRTFVVSDDGKLVKNLNQNFENFLPQNIVFADTEEIKKEELGVLFEKSLKLYFNELSRFSEYIKRFVEDRIQKAQNVPYLLPDSNQKNIDNILVTLEKIQAKLKKLDPNTAAEIKKDMEDLFAPPGRKGITFDGFEDGKRVYLLPIKSKTHSGLTRLTVTHKDGVEEMYLIKDSTYLVKNFNPEYPQVIPKVLLYKTEAGCDVDIAEPLEFLNKKISDYEAFITSKLEALESEKVAKKEQKSIDKERKLHEVEKKEKEKREINAQVKEQKLLKLAEEKAKKLQEKEEIRKGLLAKKEAEKQRSENEKQERLDLLKFYKEKVSALSKCVNKNSEGFNNLLLELQEKLNTYLNK